MTELSQHEADRGKTQERQGIAGELAKSLTNRRQRLS
jgi:hypothetical protein